MTIDEIRTGRHDEDVTRDAWCIALARRVLYLRSVDPDARGDDTAGILEDMERTKNFTMGFVGGRLEGLEGVFKEMILETMLYGR